MGFLQGLRDYGKYVQTAYEASQAGEQGEVWQWNHAMHNVLTSLQFIEEYCDGRNYYMFEDPCFIDALDGLDSGIIPLGYNPSQYEKDLINDAWTNGYLYDNVLAGNPDVLEQVGTECVAWFGGLLNGAIQQDRNMTPSLGHVYTQLQANWSGNYDLSVAWYEE